MTPFRKVLEKRTDDSRGILERLLKYTSGNAKEMAKHCVQVPPAMDYQHAKKILVRKILLVDTYIKETKPFPFKRSGDAQGYQMFYKILYRRFYLVILETNGPNVC